MIEARDSVFNNARVVKSFGFRNNNDEDILPMVSKIVDLIATEAESDQNSLPTSKAVSQHVLNQMAIVKNQTLEQIESHLNQQINKNVNNKLNSIVEVLKKLTFSDLDCVVTDEENKEQFKSLFGENVFSSITEAIEQNVETIYVTSETGYWGEYLNIKQSVNIIFASDTTLTQPEEPDVNKKALIEITGKKGNIISVNIKGNINGGSSKDINANHQWLTIKPEEFKRLLEEESRTRGIVAQYAEIKFEGNIEQCISTIQVVEKEIVGGGVYLKHCPKVEIIGHILNCGVYNKDNAACGGGVYIESSTFTLKGNIQGCFAHGKGMINGGGIKCVGINTVIVTGDILNCHAISNSSAYGGGIILDNGTNAKMTGNFESCFVRAKEVVGGGASRCAGDKTILTFIGNIINCSAESTDKNYAYGGGMMFTDKALGHLVGNFKDCWVNEYDAYIDDFCYGNLIYAENHSVCRFTGNHNDNKEHSYRTWNGGKITHTQDGAS